MDGTSNGVMFSDLDCPVNARAGMSASAELLVILVSIHITILKQYTNEHAIYFFILCPLML